MKYVFCVMMILSLQSVAFSQSAPNPDTYQIRIYAQGDSVTVLAPSPSNIDASALPCNLTPPTPPTQPVINPDFLYFVDIKNAGKVCKWPMGNGGSYLSTLNPGLYDAKLTAIELGLSSPESAPVTFERKGAPPAPTGLFFSEN